MKGFEDMQKLGKDNADATMKSLGAVSKSVQAIAVEMADYSKKAFEDGAAATERLFGAKTLEKAIEVQSDYFKTAYEGFVSQTTRLGELYSDLAQEAYKPFENYVSKVGLTR
jgi:phasin family protein